MDSLDTDNRDMHSLVTVHLAMEDTRPKATHLRATHSKAMVQVLGMEEAMGVVISSHRSRVPVWEWRVVRRSVWEADWLVVCCWSMLLMGAMVETVAMEAMAVMAVMAAVEETSKQMWLACGLGWEG
jgi:hypothetical protein